MVVFYIWNIVSFAKIFTEAETGRGRAQAISWGWVSQSPHSIPRQPTDVDGGVRHVCDDWQCLECNTWILGEGAIQSVKWWKLNVSIGGDNLFRRAFFTSSPRIALSNLHSQHRHTSRTCLAGRGRPSTNQTDQGFVCHRDASGGNRTAFIIRKTGDVIWIQPWCKLSLLVIEMRRRSCCWLRRWRMPLVTTSDRPLSTCWLPPHLLSWVIILKE